MENALLEVAAANGIWAVLFVGLFLYQLKDSRAREKKYQDTIESLSVSVAAVSEIKENLEKLTVDISALTVRPVKRKAQDKDLTV